jgi:hypothetical protein
VEVKKPKKKMPIGRRIQKGQVLNPLGAGAHNPLLKTIRRMSRDDLAEVGSLLFTTPMGEIERLAKDKTQSGLKYILLQQIVDAGKGGIGAFREVVDRVIGKVQDDVKITAGVDIKVSSDQLASMAQAALKRTKGGNE